MAVSGGVENAAFLVCLIVFYGAGTAVLQAGFQRGGALTTAGLSTLLTNALPIAAGMVLFHEPLPVRVDRRRSGRRVRGGRSPGRCSSRRAARAPSEPEQLFGA